jgi:hypothetical protein
VVGDGGRGENLVSLPKMSVNLINSCKLLWVSKDPKKNNCFKLGATSFGPSATFKCFLIAYRSVFTNEGKAHI